MSGASKVAVAGAGALGLTSALALADAGFEVTVWDPAGPFENASGVAAGMLAPSFEAVLDAEAAPHFELLLAARNLWPGLEARAGLSVDRSGAMAAGRPEWLAQIAAALSRLGVRSVELPRNTARALAPGLSEELPAALLNREDWRLDARAALAGLRKACEAAGVAFRSEPLRGRGAANLVVIATGAGRDFQALAPELAVLSPIKGHILRLQAPGLAGTVVRGEGVYAVPTADGIAVGATMEAGVADPAVDPAKAGPLRAAGLRLFPGAEQAVGELLAGVRGATPDGLPLVGPSAAPGVLLAVGARRNGWLLAPLVAQTVAAYARGGDPGPQAARLDPGRYADA